jgi:hypothetical protein
MGWCGVHKCSGIKVCERTSDDIIIKVFQCNSNKHYWFEKWRKIQSKNFPNDVKTTDNEVLIRIAGG